MLEKIFKFFKDLSIKDIKDLNGRKIQLYFSIEKERYDLFLTIDSRNLIFLDKELTFPMIPFLLNGEKSQAEITLFTNGGFKLLILDKSGETYTKKYKYYSEVNYTNKDKLVWRAGIKLLPK